MVATHFNQKRFTQSGKHSPCPICGRTKDGDCRWNDDVSLCHTHVDQDAEVEGYVHRGATTDGLWGQYFTEKPDQQKPVRPESRKDYFYPDRDGNPLVKVVRVDKGDGTKSFYQYHWNGKNWIAGLTDQVKRQVPIYRYKEVMAAIAQGKPIFMVEGEGCADELWRLGLLATTTLGGSKKYRSYGNYSQDLAGAQLILCPDRDQLGIGHMEDVAQDFPDAQWSYAFPSSPVWERLPKDRGLDIADWIADGATVEDILTAVGKKRHDHNRQRPNVAMHPTATRQQQLITEEELNCQIDDLISQDLQPSRLTSKLNLLAKETGFPTAEVKRIYHERMQEQELAESREERVAEIADLLKVGSSSLKLAEELPALYAQPLIKLAQHLSLREDVYLLALLTGLSICHRSETRLIIHRGQGFSVPLNLFAGIVSESGQRKSPVIKEIITTPLRLLQREAKAEHQAMISKYQTDSERWNSLDKDGREVEFPDGIPRQPVRQKIYFFTSTSGSESINRQVDAHPDQPVLYLKDELMGVFTQQGKYSQGRGSEKQDFLSYYDGTGSTELLTDGVRSDTETILMSIFGSVQPEVLRKFTKDCSDPDGQWARFLWVNQPLAAATLQDDASGDVDITDLLAGLYRRVCALPAIEYTLSRDAFKLYQKAYNRIEQLRINCPDPGLRAIYSKITGQLGRLIVNCHVIHELASGREFCTEVPISRVKQGIRLIHFFIEQAKIIRSEGNAAKGDLPDILAKIIRLSQRLGRVKAKQVQQNYESIKLTPDQIRNAFLELEGMGYGPTHGRGNRMEWEYAPLQDHRAVDVEQTADESVGAVGETVVAPPTDESTQWQDFQETVGEIGVVGSFPENFIQKEVDRTSGSEEPNLSASSPTTPTAPTESGNQDGNRVSAVGVSPTNSPNAPTVLLTEASSNKTSYENECSAVCGLPTAPTVRAAHNCQQPAVMVKQALVFRVGDRCRYAGPPGSMAVSCRGKTLKVLETRSNDGLSEARVQADGWAVNHWVLFQHLRRERQ